MSTVILTFGRFFDFPVREHSGPNDTDRGEMFPFGKTRMEAPEGVEPVALGLEHPRPPQAGPRGRNGG